MTKSVEQTDIIYKPRLSGASFTVRNRFMRVIWNFAWVLFFRFSTNLFPGWRVFILRCFGARIGKHCHIYPKVKIWAPWNLELHDHACLADNVTCYSQAKITLLERAIVSQGAHLCTGSHDYNDPDFPLYAVPIVIGKDAWVCAEAFVGPGVTIGEGAVLGARSVTFTDLQAWHVYTGNPAQVAKKRKII